MPNYTPEQQAFINEALEKIKEPQARLTPITRDLLNRNNFVFDAHCHVFDGQCIDVWYLITRMVQGFPSSLRRWVWRLIRRNDNRFDSLTESKMEELMYSDEEFFNEYDDIDDFITKTNANVNEVIQSFENKSSLTKKEKAELDAARKLRDIIQLVASKKMKTVYNKFAQNYGVQNLIPGHKELITVVLGMDLEYGWKRHSDSIWVRREVKIKKSNAKQIKELNELPLEYPVLPFLPLDPRRVNEPKGSEKNLYQIFLNAFTKPDSNYFGVKIYPALGYLPTDSRLAPIFEVCAKKKIPVLTHCGGEIVSTFDKKITVDDDGVISRLKSTRKQNARYLNAPERWEGVLKRPECKGLHLNLAHFGSGLAWKKPNHKISARIDKIFELMGLNDVKVFTDFSFNLENRKGTDSFIVKLQKGDSKSELMKSRCLYGTDFWVVLPMADLNDDQRYFIEKVGSPIHNMMTKNVLEFLHLNDLYV